MLLLVAVVANLQLAATLTHAWYLNSVPVRPANHSARDACQQALSLPAGGCSAELPAHKIGAVAVVARRKRSRMSTCSLAQCETARAPIQTRL